MKSINIMALLSLLLAATTYAQSACDGQPRVLCSHVLSVTQKLTGWNFNSYGKGQRQVFKGQLHTIEMNGTEHQGGAMGKTVTTYPDIYFQGKEDPRLKARASIYYGGPPGDTLTNYNPYKLQIGIDAIADHFWGHALLLSADQRIKIIPGRISTYTWTFEEFEARDVVVEYFEKSARVKHIKVGTILPVTLNTLMDANYIPSTDLDLAAAVQAGTLQIGPTDASLSTEGKFFASRWKKDKPFVINPERGKYIEVPNEELPADCLKHTTAAIGYKAVTNIPVAKLAETAVKNVKVEVLKCYGEFKEEGDR